MDPTISVAKGCFVFKNGATRANKTTKKSKNTKQRLVQPSAVLGNDITGQLFYCAYSELWQDLRVDIEKLQHDNYARILKNLLDFIANETKGDTIDSYGLEEMLPAAALLTGINQPDHLDQFETLSQRIEEKLSAKVAVLKSRDCPTLKAAVETMVYNFVEAPHEDAEDRDHKRLRRSQCTMKQLKRWYRNNCCSLNKYPNDNDQAVDSDNSDDDSSQQNVSSSLHPLVVILPDFECFSSTVLQDFILILSSHCLQIPFILVLGVATAISAVHSSLPYHVTSKIKLRVFQTESAPMALNEILEKVILSPKYPFHLSGKAFKFLTHIFLYYDFSINGFIQGFKYCLMEHFFKGNAYALCSSYSASLTKVQLLTHDDMETIRRLLSFRPYVENINDCKGIIAILTDDDYLKKKLPQLLYDCHVYFMIFRTFLELLTVLVADLPKCPLGKQRRELYTLCLSKQLNTMPEFKECWQMLSFMSKDEFVTKISNAIEVTEQFVHSELHPLELGVNCEQVITAKLSALKELLTKVVMAGTMNTSAHAAKSISPEELKQISSRHDLKEHLLKMSKQDKPVSAFMHAVQDILKYIQVEIVESHLVPLDCAPPLHELFIFSDITTVRRNIIGAPRAALHMALNNPHFYLQCKCCHLEENTRLSATLPDLSIVYKLHLECGRMINLFDWLQAFRSIVDANDTDDSMQEHVDPQIQARFTRAVAELQFLGYIKMSKRKTDHATRLTW